jgi:hypothetical protein
MSEEYRLMENEVLEKKRPQVNSRRAAGYPGLVALRKLTILLLALAAIMPTGVALARTPVPSSSGAEQTTPGAQIPAGEATPTTSTTPLPPSKPSVPTKITALPKSTIADPTAALRVRLSAPPAPRSPVPMLSPSVAGKWTAVGDYESFTPKRSSRVPRTR